MFPVKVKVEKSGENPEVGGLLGSTRPIRVDGRSRKGGFPNFSLQPV
jgi:hypothetical protein